MSNKDKQIIDVTDSEKVIETKQDFESKKPKVYIRTLNVFVNPVRRRYEKHYRERKHHLVMDVLFIIIIALLLVVNGILLFKQFNPQEVNVPTHNPYITGPFLEIEYTVNKDGSLPANPGDQLEYVLEIKNITSQTLKDVEVSVSLLSSAIDYSSLVTTGSFDEDNITWTTAQKESLRSIDPQQTVSLSFIFNVKNNIDVTNPVISSQATISGSVLNEPFEQQSKETSIKVSTSLMTNIKAIYYTEEGDQVGFGSWPLQDNEETTLRVYIEVYNTSNNITDAKLSANISPNITYTDNAVVSSGQPLTYSPESGIIWSIGQLKAGRKATASFEVSVVPSQQMIDNGIEFLDNVLTSASDQFTSSVVRQSHNKYLFKN